MLVSFREDQAGFQNSKREFMNQFSDYIEDNHNLLIKKVDAKIDIYCTEFEKNLKRLPSNLKFIKKLIYFELLPKVDKMIEELEYLKTTPNYDDRMTNVKPHNVMKSAFITCMNLFEVNNIKNMNSNKMIQGYLDGSIAIYDIESNRLICEKSLGKNRVEIISASTVRYFDTYISRLAVVLRGDTNVYLMSYNHSFSIINSESVINLKDGLQIDPNVRLSSLVSEIKFSKDSFYLSVLDYGGGVRIYKFNDPPVSKDNLISQTQHGGSGGNRKDPSMNTLSFQPVKVDTATKNQPISSISSNTTPLNIVPIMINFIKHKDPDNFTILAKKEEVVLNKDQNKDKKSNNANNTNKDQNKNNNNQAKGGAGAGHANKNVNDKNIPTITDENCYNVASIFDDTCDISPLQKLNKNMPFVFFVQKKIIFEEKGTSGFTSSLITVGAYIGFYGSNNLKFISLYPYLTENMKNLFKVIKTRGGGTMSAEENLTLNSTMLKKEKEFLSFIKSKLENINNNHANHSLNNQLPSISKNAKQETTLTNTLPKTENLAEFTKNEINFSTLFNITCMVAQKHYNNYNNLIAVGMIDGSILVWDAELHLDKFLFQEKRAEIISLSLDENYLMSGTLDGIVNIYDLLKGKLIYKNYHSTYRNYPIQNIHPIFAFISLVIDTDQNICVYSNKQKQKCGKLLLENNSKNYKISYFNRNLINFNEDYLILVCHKDKNERREKNIIELIKYSKVEFKSVLDEFQNNQEFINYYQNQNPFEGIKCSKSQILVYKIKEIVIKCFPQLSNAYRSGVSLKKIMTKYNLNELPLFEKKDKTGSTFNLSLIKNINLKNNKNSIKNSYLKAVEESVEHENLEKESFSGKTTENSLLIDLEAKDIKKNLKNISKINPLVQDNFNNSSFKDSTLNNLESNEYKAKEYSTQNKNIFYHSFKNIRDRYQMKEQRINKIQLRNESLIKEILPQINRNSSNKRGLNSAK